MKENKNLIKKNILILVLLVVVLLGSTYAWFTVNKNVKVEEIEVKVATTQDLEISVDAINWKHSINSKELLEGIHTTYPNALNQIPTEELYPVSTAGFINNAKLDMFYGEAKINNKTNLYTLTAKKEEEVHGKTGNFIAFDIFLKAAKDTTIYLNPNSSIYSQRSAENTESSGIENATRMAILKQGTATTSTAAQALNGATEAIIVEPNYDVHTATGIQHAEDIYGITGLNLTGNNSLEYYGVKNAITEGVDLTETSDAYFSKVNPNVKLKNSFFNGEEKVELFQISKGITKLRVYLWIEGQDVDCEDKASGANLNFQLQFMS